MSALGDVLRSRNTPYLLGTSLVGRLPAAMSALAIVQLVRLQGGPFAFAGSLTAIYVIAGAIGQPALGRWIDRVGQTPVLITAALTSAVGFVGMALFAVSSPWLAVVGAIVAGGMTAPLEPSLRSLWPTLVKPGPTLQAAFSLDAGAQEIIFIAGPLLTVIGIVAFGATGNMVFAAVLGIAGTLAFAANPVSRGVRAAGASSQPHRSPMRDAAFVRVVAFAFGVGLPVGLLTIIVTQLSEARHLPDIAGWGLALNAAGALTGATASALRPSARPPERLLPLFGFLLSVGYLPLAIPQLPTGIVLLFAGISGLMLPPTLAALFGWVSRAAPKNAMVESNAWVISAVSGGIAVGTAAGGILIGLVDFAGDAGLSLIILGTIGATWICSLVVLRLPATTETAAVIEAGA